MELIEPNEFNAYTRMFNLSTDQNRLIVDLHGTVNHPSKQCPEFIYWYATAGSSSNAATSVPDTSSPISRLESCTVSLPEHVPFCNFPNQSQRT